MADSAPVPLNLWGFAKRLSPRRCAAYLAWFDITPARLGRSALAGAERASRRIYPNQHPDEWVKYLPREQERRAEMRRFRAKFLIGFYLPDRVRKALLTGRYRVTACRPDGERVTLMAEDVACMSADLGENKLASPTRVFDMVAISDAAPLAHAAPRITSATPTEALTIAELARRWAKFSGGEPCEAFERAAAEAVIVGELAVVSASSAGASTLTTEVIRIMAAGLSDAGGINHIVSGEGGLVTREAFARWYKPKAVWTPQPVELDKIWPALGAEHDLPATPTLCETLSWLAWGVAKTGPELGAEHEIEVKRVAATKAVGGNGAGQDAGHNRIDVALERAAAELWPAVATGKVKAFARAPGTKEPPKELDCTWFKGKPAPQANWRLDSVMRSGCTPPIWYEVEFEADDVRALRRPPAVEAEGEDAARPPEPDRQRTKQEATTKGEADRPTQLTRLPAGNPGKGKWDAKIIAGVAAWDWTMPMNKTELCRRVAATDPEFLDGRNAASLTAVETKSIRNRIDAMVKEGRIDIGEATGEA